MFIPKNEQGVVLVFGSVAEGAGFKVLNIDCKFPDAVVEKDGEVYQAEFEFFASNFLDHGHDVTRCDMVICWENDLDGFPLPIIELSKNDWKTMKVQKASAEAVEVYYWKRRALKAEGELKKVSDVAAAPSIARAHRKANDATTNTKSDHRPRAELKRQAVAMRMKGMNGSQIAEVLGVDSSTISRWLKVYQAIDEQPTIYTNGTQETLS